MAKLAVGPMGLVLSYYAAQFKNATMTVYSGTQPATPESAITGGNIVLATWTFSSTPFGSYVNSGGYNILNGSFASTTVTPANAGTATFARISFVPVSSHGGAWTTGQAYTKHDIVTSNSAYWLCIGAGTAGATAPTGSNILGFSDGAAVWSWIQPTASGLVLGDFTVGTTTSFDVQVNSVTFDPAVNQTITAFAMQTQAA